MAANSQADTRRGNARPWFRLHWLSWVLMLLMMAGMTIMIVPGTFRNSMEYEPSPLGPRHQSKYEFMEVSTWSHGWPFEHLRRAASNAGFFIDYKGYPIIWSSPQAWQASGKVFAFSPLKLLANLLIGAAIVIGTVAAFDVWRRRRGGFRFSLLDAAVLTAIVCIILGWWQYHTRTYAKEQAIKDKMIARGGLTDPSKRGPLRAWATSSYHGPDWLQRLIGNSYFLPFCFHIDHLYLDSTLLSSGDYIDIRQLTYVDTVKCVDRLDPELVNCLATLPRLRTIDGRIGSFGGGTPYPERMVTSSNVQLLARLPQLTNLFLGHSKLAPADLAIVAQLPRLKFLHVAGDDLLIEDYKPIVRCPTLQTLYLNISATEDERLAFTASHPHLALYWADARRSRGFTEYTLVTDPWNVASVIFNRWQSEDGVEHPTALEREWLDFSNIRLTRKRLDRLPVKRFPDVTSVYLGKVDSSETAINLIRRCGPLGELDTRHISLTARDIESIAFAEDPILHVQQGPITVHEFCNLARKLKPNWLEIYDATFDNKEVEQIVSAIDGIVDVYKRFGLDDDERIPAAYELEDQDENPFE